MKTNYLQSIGVMYGAVFRIGGECSAPVREQYAIPYAPGRVIKCERIPWKRARAFAATAPVVVWNPLIDCFEARDKAALVEQARAWCSLSGWRTVSP